MSKKETAIKSIITHFIKSDKPLYVHAYSWSCFNEQMAVSWLRNKKFLNSKKIGDRYKLTRSNTFYDIYEEIKNMSANKIIQYLKESGKDIGLVKTSAKVEQ
jgi:hypothetical protein